MWCHALQCTHDVDMMAPHAPKLTSPKRTSPKLTRILFQAESAESRKSESGKSETGKSERGNRVPPSAARGNGVDRHARRGKRIHQAVSTVSRTPPEDGPHMPEGDRRAGGAEGDAQKESQDSDQTAPCAGIFTLYSIWHCIPALDTFATHISPCPSYL